MVVKQVLMYECSICKRQYKSMPDATGCLTKCQRIVAFRRKYPRVKDKDCDFANGAGWIQRDKAWYDQFCQDLENLIRQNHPKIFHEIKGITVNDGRMGRVLSDADYDEYEFWGRLLAICDKCYREWGQPYYAIHCHHDGSTDEGFSQKRTQKPEWIEPKAKKMNPSER